MHKEKFKDVYAGVFVLAVGLILFAASFSVPKGAAVSIGSDFMPKVTCGLMAVLGGIITWNGNIQAKKYSENNKNQTEEKKHYKELAASVAALFVYMILLVPVGFVIMTTVYITVQSWILSPKEKKNPVKFFMIGAVASAVIYSIFRNIFVLMLPAGILGF